MYLIEDILQSERLTLVYAIKIVNNAGKMIDYFVISSSYIYHLQSKINSSKDFFGQTPKTMWKKNLIKN